MVRFITEFSSSLSGRSERPQVENEQGSVVKSITGNDSLLVPSFFSVGLSRSERQKEEELNVENSLKKQPLCVDLRNPLESTEGTLQVKEQIIK